MPEHKSVGLPVFRTSVFCASLAVAFLLTGCTAQPVKTPEATSPEPVDAATLNNRALLLLQQHRYNEAAVLLETGLQSSPQVAELHYNLAVISELYLLDLDRALSHYQLYQSLSAEEDKKVTGWIADLQRRLE
ncbi:hypothetical protein [Marinobacter sp.]|uniref:hypothetical protein n=1 Tax=Marinobacter sp. TaxID=50741 RepID=UPI003A90C343